MVSEQAISAQCGNHPESVAMGACERCGRFACVACGRSENQRFLCVECFARPDVRLVPSQRAKRSLWLALIGLHGVVFMLPVAIWSARMELIAIERGDSSVAGKPWARGAIAICGVAAVGWLIVGILATR